MKNEDDTKEDEIKDEDGETLPIEKEWLLDEEEDSDSDDDEEDFY